jgi:hypothetical protein
VTERLVVREVSEGHTHYSEIFDSIERDLEKEEAIMAEAIATAAIEKAKRM